MSRPGFATPERLATLERALVVLIALHSLVVGLFLTLATEWGARFGGFPSPVPLFFPRQAGAFHFVVAAIYLVEYFHYRGVGLLVMTKSMAVVFLFLTAALDSVPWVVPLSGVGDGLMAVAVVLLRRARGLPLLGPGRGRPGREPAGSSPASRRQALALLGAGLPGVGARLRAPGSRPTGGCASRLASLDPAGRVEIEYAGEPAEVVRTASGVVARSLLCSHFGCRVQWEAAEGALPLPLPRGRSSTGEGRLLGGPPTRPLRALPVEVSGQDILVGER